jgi:excisionase family DNA binding protein
MVGCSYSRGAYGLVPLTLPILNPQQPGVAMFYTIKEVAATLTVSKYTVHRMADRGDFKTVKVGGQWRVPKVSLEAYLASLAA